ncbi:MAG: hypothetical protein RR053_08615, partial [Evtepia sp.]
INQLARTIQKRIQDITPNTPVLDFAGIQADFSLKTNLFPLPIPAQDYQICQKLAPKNTLHPGDRVLVAWVGNDAVVIDILCPATVAM